MTTQITNTYTNNSYKYNAMKTKSNYSNSLNTRKLNNVNFEGRIKLDIIPTLEKPYTLLDKLASMFRTTEVSLNPLKIDYITKPLCSFNLHYNIYYPNVKGDYFSGLVPDGFKTKEWINIINSIAARIDRKNIEIDLTHKNIENIEELKKIKNTIKKSGNSFSESPLIDKFVEKRSSIQNSPENDIIFIE